MAKQVVPLGRSQPVHVARKILDVMSQLDQADVPISLISAVVDHVLFKDALDLLESERVVTLRVSAQTVHLNRQDWQALRWNLRGTTEQHQYLILTLRGLYDILPTDFMRPLCLHQGRSLRLHVDSVLHLTMECKLSPEILKPATDLALCYSTYLVADGYYAKARCFLSEFRTWAKDLLMSQVKLATALVGHEAIVETLSGFFCTSSDLFVVANRERTTLYGEKAIETIHSLNNTAVVYHDQGRYNLALQYHNKALALKKTVSKVTEEDLLVSLNNIGVVLQAQGQHLAADLRFNYAYTGWKRALGPDSLLVLAAKTNQGISACLQGRLDDAETHHRIVFMERERILGPAHLETLKSRANLALVTHYRGNYRQSEEAYRDLLECFQRSPDLGPSHPETLKTYTDLASVLAHQGNFGEAVEIVTEALPLAKARFGPSNQQTFKFMEMRAIYLHYREDYVAGVAAASELYQTRLAMLGADDLDTKKSLEHLRDLQRELLHKEVALQYRARLYHCCLMSLLRTCVLYGIIWVARCREWMEGRVPGAYA